MPLYQSGVSDIGVESSVSALSWGPVIGGAVAASATALILLLLGAGVGLTMVSPWAGESASFTTVSITAAIWFVVVQWLSSALGGYLTGRLRTKWAGVHTDEVFFRDTAHGFLSWALATVFVAGLAGSAFTSLVGGGIQALTSATSTAATAGAAGRNVNAGPDFATGYFTDALLRRQDLRNRVPSDDAAAAAEISRILIKSAGAGIMTDEDKTYLSAVVASRTGLTPEEATARVDTILQRMDEAKVAAQQAADKARKSAATTAMLGALSLLVGAFIASAAAALGGRQRDDDEMAVTRV